jgi:hypothetical protein
MLPLGKLILPVANFVVSVVLLGVLFGAIYKVLPDRSLQWNDVVIGRAGYFRPLQHREITGLFSAQSLGDRMETCR